MKASGLRGLSTAVDTIKIKLQTIFISDNGEMAKNKERGEWYMEMAVCMQDSSKTNSRMELETFSMLIKINILDNSLKEKNMGKEIISLVKALFSVDIGKMTLK